MGIVYKMGRNGTQGSCILKIDSSVAQKNGIAEFPCPLPCLQVEGNCGQRQTATFLQNYHFMLPKIIVIMFLIDGKNKAL